MRSLAITALTLVALCSSAMARDLTRGVKDVTVISDAAGESRVLFKLDSSIALQDVALRRAILTFKTSGRTSSSALRLRVHPLTASWSAGAVGWNTWTRGGGDFDDEVYAKADVAFGGSGSTVRLDVTDLVREMLAGAEYHGFLLTVDPSEGKGIPATDIAALETMSGASLKVKYRKVPPAPRG